MTTPQDLAAQIEALEKTEAWLRECSDWMLSNDLDMQCPMQTDPLDLADALPAIVAAIRHDVPDLNSYSDGYEDAQELAAIRQGEGAGDRISREETASTIERTTIADGASASAMLVFLAAAIRDDRVTPSISPAPDERFSFGRCKDCPGDHSRMCCKTQTSAGSSVPSDQALQVLQAEEYRNMHSIATEDLGYPSILEALEATPHAEQLGEEIGYISAPDERDDEVRRLKAALEWYGEQARLARLIHSEGDAGRHALSDDGGNRARAALSPAKGGV